MPKTEFKLKVEPPINVNLKNFLGVTDAVLQFGFEDGPMVNRGRIEGWVNEGLFQIAREVEAPEFQEKETYMTQVGVWEYPLPCDFLRTQDVWYPERSIRLKPVDLLQFNMMSPQNVQGIAQTYALYQNLLLIFPSP